MQKRLKILLPVLTVTLMGLAGKAHALGTASGTVVGNFATMTATNVPSATQSSTVNATVMAVFGVAKVADPADGNAGSGNSTDYVFSVRNDGNDSDYIGIKAGAQGFSAGAGTTTNWSVQVDDADPFSSALNWQTSGAATASQAGDQATSTAILGPDAVGTYTVRVTIAGDATDGATGDLTINFVTVATAGSYVGYNAINYGGPASVARSAGTGQGTSYLTTLVQGPVLTLSKAINVITAPAGYTGGANDPVPGARITYDVTFGNSGAGAASTVEVSDQIPASTTFEAGTIQSCFTSTACGPIADADADAAGDDCWYTTVPVARVGCDIALIASGGGGKVRYNVTID
ncbi:MAG: hypothetical protein AB1742_10815 [bacterium]